MQVEPLVALGCCLFGAVVGDMHHVLDRIPFRRGILRDHRWFARFVTPEREEQIEENFRLHGFKVFFLARFLVGIRSPVYLTAGILRVSFRRYFLIDLDLRHGGRRHVLRIDLFFRRAHCHD